LTEYLQTPTIQELETLPSSQLATTNTQLRLLSDTDVFTTPTILPHIITQNLQRSLKLRAARWVDCNLSGHPRFVSARAG
jgi:hypothetical protein